jgi:hypothetical protein
VSRGVRAKDNDGVTTCFVIGPIGDRLAGHGTAERQTYEEALQVLVEVIVPACASVGIDQPERADQIAQPGEIPDQIFERLRDADVVIADLSGANPNVMYELGLRHSLNRITVQLAERGPLPFDTRAIRTVQFVRTEHGLIDAKGRLERTLREGLQGRFSPVAATRIWLDRPPDAVPPTDAEPASEPPDDGQEPGMLDRLAASEAAFPELVELLNEMTAVLNEVSRFTTEATERTTESDARGGGAAGRLAAAASLAKNLEDPASRYEALALDFEKKFVIIDSGVTLLLEAVEKGEAERDSEEVKGFIQSISGFIDVTLENIERSEAMAATIEDNMRIARVLRPTLGRLARSVRYFAKTSSLVKSWQDWLARLQANGQLGV